MASSTRIPRTEMAGVIREVCPAETENNQKT